MSEVIFSFVLYDDLTHIMTIDSKTLKQKGYEEINSEIHRVFSNLINLKEIQKKKNARLQ
jgi:hypothetical protein